MSNEILQIINLLLFIGLVVCVYILVSNSIKSVKILKDIEKNLRDLIAKK